MKIFIHSLFRTGSTYVFTKFRQNSSYCCFYEPLHEALIDLKGYLKINARNIIENPLRHPYMEEQYFFEYENFIDPETSGVPYFQKSFTADEFCHLEENIPLKKYIDFLILQASPKIPVLQFNRTTFRLKWFKTNYPDSLNIYLVRDPRDMWMSHLSILNEGNPYFMAMCLLWASINKNTPQFAALSKFIPLIDCYSHVFNNHLKFYGLLLDAYSQTEKYFIFYFIWLTALIDSIFFADIIIDMNQLSESESYRQIIANSLTKNGINGVNFSDARVPRYRQPTPSSDQMAAIEHQVQATIFGSMGKERTDIFMDSISNKMLISSFKYQNEPSFENLEQYPHANSLTDWLTSTIKVIADHYMEYTNELQQVQQALDVAHTYSRSMENEINRIRKSKIYKYLLKYLIK